jgi:hypothetical protein
MRSIAIFSLFVPFSLLAQSEPTSMSSSEVEDLITRTCLSREGDTAKNTRIDACNRYLKNYPNGVWLEEVQMRLKELVPSSSSAPVEETDEIDLSEFAHPRKAGDATLLIGIGNNSPSGNFGIQGGYYATPRAQLSAGLGVDDKHLRGGLMSRLYLRDSRISPAFLLGLSFATGRQATGEGIDPATELEEVVLVELGPSLLAHAGLGVSFRYISGFSLNAEAGYAQPLFEQTVDPLDSTSPPLSNEAQVLDGGLFFSIALGFTFSQLF